MQSNESLPLFEGGCFSELFEADIQGARYGFLLSYPSTAAWSPYPNNRRYFIQDGNLEHRKVPFDQIRQKEPWKIMSVLGNGLAGILTSRPPNTLIQIWRDYLGFSCDNMVVLPHRGWGDILNHRQPFDKLIMLFPYDRIAPDLHAIDPDRHYRLLSKISLAEFCPRVPPYRVVDLRDTPLPQVCFPDGFPYAVKTSHGLSGEGTYIIRNPADLAHCLSEIRLYQQAGTLTHRVIMTFVEQVVGNYCVQFYVDRQGGIRMIGATTQLVTETGIHLGGMIRYRETRLSPFFPIVKPVGAALRAEGYFGVVGLDILEDRDGALHVIDANVRVNGSTPLCLLRNTFLKAGKETARYTTGFYADLSLDRFRAAFAAELDRKDFVILSALEYPSSRGARTELYGIVAGEDPSDLIRVSRHLEKKGLKSTA